MKRNLRLDAKSAVLALGPTDADADGDWMDDAWEIEHFADTARDGTGDFDGDGIDDFTEFQLDTDPTLADTDKDGLPDRWEFVMGLLPAADDAGSDADNDGMTNLEEYRSVVYRFEEAQVSAMAISANLLFTVDGQSGRLDVIDIADAAAPALLGS